MILGAESSVIGMPSPGAGTAARKDCYQVWSIVLR